MMIFKPETGEQIWSQENMLMGGSGKWGKRGVKGDSWLSSLRTWVNGDGSENKLELVTVSIMLYVG